MQTSCSEDLPQPPPGTFLILVSYVSLYRSHSTTLAVPHKYAAVEIPASYSHRKTAKSTLVLFENGKKNGKELALGSALRALNRESSTAQ